MPEFTLNRAYNLVGRGHNIRFEKDVPTYVPPELAKAAVGIGAERVDGEPTVVLDPEEAEPVVLSPDEKEEFFYSAFDSLTSTNDREDFDGSGTPTVDALRARGCDFSFTKKEVVNVWRKYVAAKNEQ